ncbi:MAG: hypothetical protein QG610_2137, partial [Euryarchaeota archaeon]|nr:hypothetical protein [Euryarchaeota archaeon]
KRVMKNVINSQEETKNTKIRIYVPTET